MSAEGTALTFKYDHNGLRTQKVVEASWYPETTNYYLHGKLLTHMTVDYTDFDEVAHQDKLHFFYDESSRPAQVNFNSIIYTYIHNLQGEIVGLLDSTGALVVEYKYDAWGKLISTTGAMADTLGKRNPFRHRGYVYDEETGLYYLRSRYYNPTVGRFVNEDNVLDNVSAEDEQPLSFISGFNLYAYAANNPVDNIDDDGQSWKSVKKELRRLGLITAAITALALIAAGTGRAGAFALAAGYSAVKGVAVAKAVAAVTGIAASTLLFASTDRPKSNKSQNEQYRSVMRELGIKKTDPMWRRIHDALPNGGKGFGYKKPYEFAKNFIKNYRKR